VSVVLDTSVTLAWIHLDENTQAAGEVLDLVTQSGAWVPTIWPLEVANGLQQGVRRGRLNSVQRDAALASLALLAIAIDPETNTHAWSATLALCTRFTLTTYDAAYLELALRRSLPLATLDGALRAASGAVGVQLLGM
jgi:predicted nucleic acid-binding protein